MPRPKILIPSYRKHRASGQAFVELNGRRFYLGPHGTKASKLQYDRLVCEYLASGRSTSFGSVPDALTVVELVADYLKYAREYYGTSATSEFHQMRVVMRPVRQLYGRHPAHDFGPLQFKAVRQQLIDRGNARTTINMAMRRVTRMFRWAVAEGRLPPSVPQALALVPGLRRGKSAARESEPVGPVDDAVVAVTLPFLSPVVAAMVQLQRLTGARPAEICSLRPCDLDTAQDVWIYRPRSHKTQHRGKDRLILIGPKGQALLQPYLNRQADSECFRPSESERWRLSQAHARRKTPLSCGNRPGSNRKPQPKRQPGDHYDTNAYRRAIAYACDKAFPHPRWGGVPVAQLSPQQLAELKQWQSDRRWSPNQLRHAVATAIRRDFGLEAAQVILGHSQAYVTQIYAQRDLSKGIAVAKEIG